MTRRLLVVADRLGHDAPGAALAPFLSWLRATTGWRAQLLVWDRADLEPGLTRLRPVHEVEAINRWRLPIWLGHRGHSGAMRALRYGRARLWAWRSRRCRAVYLYGPLRPEMRHYLPDPSVHRVGDLTVPDGPQGAAARLAETEALAAAVISGLPALSAHDGWSAPGQRRRRRARLGLPPRSVVVGGWGRGPDHPWDGLDLFLRAAAQVDVGGREVAVVWMGGDPSTTRAQQMRHEVDHLGMGDRFLHLPEDVVDAELVEVLDVLVLTHLGPGRSWPLDRLRVLGLPVVRFDHTPAGAAGPCPDRVAEYPDVAALAAQTGAAAAALAGRQSHLERRAAALDGS